MLQRAKIKIEDNNNGFTASEINVANGGRDLRIAAPQDIYFEDVDTGEKHLYIENGGNIGIGTDNPATKLDVVDGDITIRNGSEHNAIRTTPDGKLQFLRNGAANNQVTVTIDDANGNVGIGSTIPTQALDVAGRITKTEYEPGEIIETLQGVCDGNDVTVQSGTYTLANVNAVQEAGIVMQQYLVLVLIYSTSKEQLEFVMNFGFI